MRYAIVLDETRIQRNTSIVKDTNDSSHMVFAQTWEGRHDCSKAHLRFSFKECIIFEEQSLELRSADNVQFGLLRAPHFFMDDVDIGNGEHRILQSDNYHKSYQCEDETYNANLRTLI